MSCFVWGVFLLIFYLIGRGQFEILYQYKRCYANCFYNKNSWIFTWVTKKSLVILFSGLIALPLSLSLMSFAALADFFDFAFMLLSMVITSIGFIFFEKFFHKHVTDKVNKIVAKRMTVLLSMLIMVLIYYLASYYVIPVPQYLDPTSLNHTIELASKEVGSTCSVTNYFLKFMHEFDAISWFGMTMASKSIDSDYFIKLLWVIFFINHALVFAALARLQLEFLTILQIKQTQ